MLKGTEKQVKWAEDIKSKLIEKTNSHKEVFVEIFEEEFDLETSIKAFELIKKGIESIEDSKTFIENRNYRDNISDFFDYVCQLSGILELTGKNGKFYNWKF